MIGKIVDLTAKQANDFLLPKHYSGRKANISIAYGWVVDEELKAVITFGKPANHYLCTGVCGEEYSENVYELNRLCRVDGFDQPLSQFVSAVLRRLRVKHWIIVSYSDTQMNHHGYIYQACNFIYTGCTRERTDIWSGKHSRHYTQQDKETGKRVVRSAKHRYIYFCTYNKKEKELWKESLKYPIMPYPKGDNSEDYKLGEYIKPIIV